MLAKLKDTFGSKVGPVEIMQAVILWKNRNVITR